MNKPFIGIANSWNEVVPGHIHLNRLVEEVKAGIIEAGGVPFIYGVPAVCDGIAMGHAGMRYSLPSRETISDCVEIMNNAHCFDGWVGVTNCDKIDARDANGRWSNGHPSAYADRRTHDGRQPKWERAGPAEHF